MVLHKLNPFAVSLEGRHLVEASAGTGKTYNITSLFIRYLIEKSADVNQILVLTYTRAATAELKERIMKRLRESADVLKNGAAPPEDEFLNQLLEAAKRPAEAAECLDSALHNFDEASIFTIHGFCQRALQEQSFLSGMLFDTDLVTDDSDFPREAIDDYWRKLISRAEESETDRIWLNILREEHYLPDALAKMVSAGIGKPYLELFAESPAGDERSRDLKELSNIFRKLKAIWAGQKDEIQALLLSDAMNGNRYRASSVPVWMDELDRWFEGGIPSLNYIDKFDRFSIRFIREKGVKKGEEAPDHPFFHEVDAYIRQAEQVRSWLPAFKKELLHYTRTTSRERKLSMGVLGYDDLLVLLNEALNHLQNGPRLAEYLRDKYPVALVDEFQDTDPVQYEILTSIYDSKAAGHGLFLIGDPKQSIYSFRGADVFSYLKARSEIPEKQNHGLSRNFRSDPDLIRSVNMIFERIDRPFMVENIEFEPATAGNKRIESLLVDGEKPPPLRFLQSDSLKPDDHLNKSEARERASRVTAESIARLLNKGEDGSAMIGNEQIRAKDIAVLVRTHEQAETVRIALEKRGIKSVQYSQMSVFDTDEARNIELLLKAIAEPKNERMVRSVLATELFPSSAGDLLGFEKDEQSWTEELGRFNKWHHTWQKDGFATMFRTFLNDAAIEKQLVTLNQGERKLTNTLQLGELLQLQDKEKRGGMFELVRWLTHKRKDPDKNADEEQLRLESDEELVKIVTMHRSKGLEYPVTYCPFLWDGTEFRNTRDPFLYHDPERGNQPSLEFNEKGHPERSRHRFWAAMEEISESLRLAYVAMTRAKQHCTIVYESVKGFEFSALGYLLAGRASILKQLKDKILSEGSTSYLPGSEFYRKLEAVTAENDFLIDRQVINDQQQTVFESARLTRTVDKPSRIFSVDGEIQSRSTISSFSSIMHPSATEDDEIISDEIFLPDELHTGPEDEIRTIFSFPRGPQAGTCIHQIFEDLNFGNPDSISRVIEDNLLQFGFTTEWSGVVEKMVLTVLDTDLKNGIQLNGLSDQDLVKEMEFYFDLQPFRRNELLEIIRDNGSMEGDVFFKIPAGFMKGYIDLVFKWDNRYYILDYKSNYLGDGPLDYREELLEEEMELAGYDVQYNIYSVALHRYLGHRIREYSYEDHFGGVFYLFVRGMGHDDPQKGIFFDRPAREKIEQLDTLFRIAEAGGS